MAESWGRREWIAGIVLGGLAPYLVYEWTVPPLPEVEGLIWGAVPPAAWQLFAVWRARRLDPVSAFSLLTTLVALILAWTSASDRAVLLREAWMTGLVGCVSLASSFTRRPLLFFILRTAMEASGEGPFERRWDASAPLRRGAAQLTLVWGISGVLDMGVRLLLIDRVSTLTFLMISPVLFWTNVGAVAVLTFVWGGRIRDRMDAEENAVQSVDS